MPPLVDAAAGMRDDALAWCHGHPDPLGSGWSVNPTPRHSEAAGREGDFLRPVKFQTLGSRRPTFTVIHHLR